MAPHNDHASEKSRFSARMTNPFRRNQAARQEPEASEKANQNAMHHPAPDWPKPDDTKASSSEVFLPPPGPPPSAQQDFATQDQPPAYAPWMAIPDTSALPPPPALSYEESPSANATALSADKAREWCATHPLDPPRRSHPSELAHLSQTGTDLCRPPIGFSGKMTRCARGTWLVQSRPSCPDSILVTELPLYRALEDHPHVIGKPRTVYFEVKVIRINGGEYAGASAEADAGIAVGYVAPPYPHWRLPGWERASLGVHGDDGRKYVDNNMGGQDFTTSFKDGEVVGIGVTFGVPPPNGARGPVEVFFTREGERQGGWDLYEERDGEGGGSVQGLGGERDLLGAIGIFGCVELEARFRRDQWLYRPAL